MGGRLGVYVHGGAGGMASSRIRVHYTAQLCQTMRCGVLEYRLEDARLLIS